MIDTRYVNWYEDNIVFIGQTDFRHSKEAVYPSWYGFAMRDKAPFKESVDKWYLAPKFKVLVIQPIFSGLNGLLNLVLLNGGWQRPK